MKLTAADLAIIANTLHGSLGIVGNTPWMYSKEARERALENVHGLLQEVEIQVTDSQSASQEHLEIGE